MTGPIRAGVRRLFRLAVRRGDSIREQMDEELRFHLDARVAHFIARGMTPEGARAEAMRRLGTSLPETLDRLGRSAVRREQRMAMRERIDDLMHDVRYAVRGLMRRPGFAVVAVFTLAIGIGANTAIFSAVDALLLRALPFNNPSRLSDIALTSTSGGPTQWSWPKFQVYRNAQRSYSSVALTATMPATLTGADPDRISIESVTAAYLTTLGVRITMGHDFPAEQDSISGDAPKRALLSNSLWQRRFQADPNVVGKFIHIDSDAYEIIGVLPPTFLGLSGKADVLIPVTARPTDELAAAQAWSLEYTMIGRLKPGVMPGRAASEARILGERVYDAYPFGKGMFTTGTADKWTAVARPLDTIRVAATVRRSLLVLFVAVGIVLLIACVNLANLLLGRASSRRQEIAVRLAIGAGRARLVRLLLTESLLLALAGGTASVLVGWWGTHLLRTLNDADALSAQGLASGIGGSGFESIRLDPRALVFTFAVTMFVGVFFGLVPALQATRPQLTAELKDGSSGSGLGGVRLGATRRILVVAEVALALMLLAGSGLMLRSLRNLMGVNPGFDSDRVLTLRLSVPPGVVAPDSMPGFYQEMQSALAAVPGVLQVALADCPPLNGGCNATIMTFPDRPQTVTGNAMVGVHWVSPSWFGTMRVPVKRGRLFTTDDRLGGPKVVVINEAAARKYFPNEDPVGKTVKVFQGGFDAGATVIGIVGDVRFGTVNSAAAPDTYISYNQARVSRMMIFLRTAGNPLTVVASARRTLHVIAPLDPVFDIRTMSERVGAATSQARFSATLLTLFAVIALGLAFMGIYGVMSFGVAQRTREIGIRIALGADRTRVLRMIVREGAVLVTIGAAIGLAAAFALTRLLRTLLFEVAPTDPVTYVGIVVVVGVAALVASWLPARQASRVEPTEALRR